MEEKWKPKSMLGSKEAKAAVEKRHEEEAAEMDTDEPPVEEDVSQNDNAGDVAIVDKNLEFLDQIRKLVSDGRKNSELAKELLPYLHGCHSFSKMKFQDF